MYADLNPAEKYVVLALASNEIIKDRAIVFHYFGPKELQKHARFWTKKKVTDILTELDIIEADIKKSFIDELPFFRKTFLLSQIKSLRNTLKLKKGKLIGRILEDAVHDITGLKILPPFNLDVIRREKLQILHTSGFNDDEQFLKEVVAKEKKHVTDNDLRKWILVIKEAVAADIIPNIFCGHEFLDFFKKSKVKVITPQRGYPSCYYVYNGNGNATISLSGYHRRNELLAVCTLLHELHPGHHFYYLYREHLYNMGLLGVEATIDLLCGSETPINEGIAETAHFHLRSLPEDFLTKVKISTAREHFFKKILYNVWHGIYIDKTMTSVQAKKYLLQNGCPKERVGNCINFLRDWTLYYPAYPLGTEMMKKSDLYYLHLPKSVQSFKKTLKAQFSTD